MTCTATPTSGLLEPIPNLPCDECALNTLAKLFDWKGQNMKSIAVVLRSRVVRSLGATRTETISAGARKNETGRCASEPALRGGSRLLATRFLDGESSKPVALKSILPGHATGLLANTTADALVKMFSRNTAAATVSFARPDLHGLTDVPDLAYDAECRSWPAYVAIKAFVRTDVTDLSW
jgi:hypothetical protein